MAGKLSMACLESLSEDLDDNIESVDGSVIDEHMEDVNDAVAEMDEVGEDASDMLESATALDELTAAAQNIEEPTEAVMEALALAINYHGRRLNEIYEREIFPVYGKDVAVESVVATLAGLRTGLKNLLGAFLVYQKAFQDAYTALYALADKFLKQTKKLRAKLSTLDNTPAKAEINISSCRILAYQGKVDARSIIIGAKQTHKVLDIVTDDYRKKLFQHFSNVFVAYQKAIKEAGYIDYENAAYNYAEGLKPLNDFKDAVNSSFKATTGVLPDNLEISGGYIFGFKSVVMTSRPRLYERPQQLINNKQTIKTPSKAEIKEMLDLVDSISDIVYQRKTWLIADIVKIIKDGHDAVSQTHHDDKHGAKLMRIMAGIDGYYANAYNLVWYTSPIAQTSRLGFVVSRGLLSVCEKAIAAYPTK
jgi:hypothetical protein